MKLLTHFGYFSDRPRISIYIRISTDFFKCIFSVIIIWDNIISLYFFLITLCNLSPYEKTRLVQILWDASVNWINRYIFFSHASRKLLFLHMKIKSNTVIWMLRKPFSCCFVWKFLSLETVFSSMYQMRSFIVKIEAY